MELRGEERITLELTGALPEAQARRHVPARFALETREGEAVVGLLCFQMKGLKLLGVPGPAFDYSEALWRIGVVEQGQPGWFAVACDLDHRLVRALGRQLIRYPTRAGALSWSGGEETTFGVAGEHGGLRLRARASGENLDPVPPRRAFVGNASLYEVPWREDPAPYRRAAALEVLDDALTRATLGEVRWEPSALLHRGRIHRCGFAHRL